ncbi:MAG: 2-oxo acid dehydrogenase subunit E2 [Oscillospiraceae bacterium]|nr:2-oxo acid dehydrogenase subunit E2 [Oscillospiraceae bacterium]
MRQWKRPVEGDPNYTTILCSNLGSIKCPAVDHHLNNYGTNSIMITIGTLHKDEVTMPDGHREIRDVIDVGATLDERIADGFYFARSLKLIKHIFAHPKMLDQPLNVPSGFDYQ